jgi:hypothetical protein
MMGTVPELQPDELEVLQAEETGPDPLIRVDLARAEVPVRTQMLPRKAGATLNRTIDTNGRQLLKSDHRRASVTVMSIGQNVYLGFSNASYQDLSTMLLWPANVPFVMQHDGELWVRSAATTTVVSLSIENWATGE